MPAEEKWQNQQKLYQSTIIHFYCCLKDESFMDDDAGSQSMQ